MHRFYADDGPADGGNCEFLTDEDSRHALTVLRLRPGAQVELITGGQRWLAEMVGDDRRMVRVRKLSLLPSTEARLRITLCQGLPKSDKMDLIVQKATELGVARIIPVMMERCVVRISTADSLKKLERWRKIAREAGKQSGRCIQPEILEPVRLSELIDVTAGSDLKLVPWEEADSHGPLTVFNSCSEARTLTLVIGPEGGISTEEIEQLTPSGFQTITLGKRILRTETAGLAAVAAFMSLYGEMEQA